MTHQYIVDSPGVQHSSVDVIDVQVDFLDGGQDDVLADVLDDVLGVVHVPLDVTVPLFPRHLLLLFSHLF